MALKCLHHPLQSAVALNESSRKCGIGKARESNLVGSNVSFIGLRTVVGVGMGVGRPLKVQTQASLFTFLKKKKDKQILKDELLEAIAPLDRGAEATPDDQYRVDQIAQELEVVNPTKEPLRSNLLNGKWELLYTTSETILKRQVTANLTPISGKRVAVKFDEFKIAGLISVKAPERARGELEITYLDDNLRISRGDKGNLFVLRMVDPTYRVPL